MPKTPRKHRMKMYCKAPLSFKLIKATSVDPETHKKISAAFLELRDRQDAKANEILQAVYDKVISVSEVWAAYPNKLHKLPLHQHIYIHPGFDVWADKYGARVGNSTTTTDRYKQAFKSLRTSTKGSTVEDLPNMLAQYRKQCEDQERYRAFDVAKTAVQSYIRNTLGRNNNIYRSLMDIEKLETEPKNPQRALDYKDVLTIMERLPEKYAVMFWALVTTGMRPAEYWGGRYEVQSDRVHIMGTKTKPSVRSVPRIGDGPKPYTTTKKYLRIALKKAWSDDTAIYITRKTATKLWSDSGIFMVRRNLYQGRSIGGMTQSEYYEIPADLTKDLRADAHLIADYIKRAGKSKLDSEEEYKPPTVKMPNSRKKG